MKEIIKIRLDEHIENMNKLVDSSYCDVLEKIIQLQIKTLSSGNKILIAGNGESASDAQHYAGEIVGRFLMERKGLPAIALNTDTSVLTCIGNDYGYDKVFSRQVEALGVLGDLFIGISTSGNSDNIIEAVHEARSKGIKTIGLLGKNGGKLKEICDVSLIIPFESTARVQEAHILAIHTMCEIVEKEMAEKQ